jgi:hypothetical protein
LGIEGINVFVALGCDRKETFGRYPGKACFFQSRDAFIDFFRLEDGAIDRISISDHSGSIRRQFQQPESCEKPTIGPSEFHIGRVALVNACHRPSAMMRDNDPTNWDKVLEKLSSEV